MSITGGTRCPCGSGLAYEACCGRYHAGESAPTAEALMRSRYSAYALTLEAYLRATWHPDSCPADLSSDPRLRWMSLKLLDCEAGSADDHQGKVRFVARYKLNGRAGRLEEISRFVRVDGRWCYLDGEVGES